MQFVLGEVVREALLDLDGSVPNSGKLRGVLWEQKPARTQVYKARYSVRTDEADRQLCRQQGVLIGKELADGGSDIATVLDGYISVGKLKNFLL